MIVGRPAGTAGLLPGVAVKFDGAFRRQIVVLQARIVRGVTVGAVDRSTRHICAMYPNWIPLVNCPLDGYRVHIPPYRFALRRHLKNHAGIAVDHQRIAVGQPLRVGKPARQKVGGIGGGVISTTDE